MKKTKELFSRFFKNRLRAGVIIVLILAVIFFGWQKVKGSQQTVQYQTTKVAKGTIVSSISVSGQIATAGKMTVTSQASGVVKDILVKNGDHVSQGQTLMTVTPDSVGLQRQQQAYANYLSAQNSLASDNAKLYSLQSTMMGNWKTYMDTAQNSTYQNSDETPNTANRALPQFYEVYDNWLNSEAQYKNQQGVITQDQAALSNSWLNYQAASSTITAPAAGIVQDITLVPGMTLAAQSNSQSSAAVSQKIATITTGNTIAGQFSVAEIDVGTIKEGEKTTLTLDAFPDKTFTGTVTGVDRTGAVSSGVTNYPLTITFDPTTANILPNMSATANIITATKDRVLLVPSSAVQTSGTQSYVRVLQNGNPVSMPVQTGISSDTQIEIVSGISEGDDVITGTLSGSAQTSSGSRSVFSSGFGGGGGGGALRVGGFGGR
ncbi:MAG: HlyD family efflux transporter periplasmic adaptor subunit [Patescibacteria group bacterium]|nr:HlyD family efflux transporter periplasmic adaptor subunit [Patescibacteria group bacterium]